MFDFSGVTVLFITSHGCDIVSAVPCTKYNCAAIAANHATGGDLGGAIISVVVMFKQVEGMFTCICMKYVNICQCMYIYSLAQASGTAQT